MDLVDQYGEEDANAPVDERIFYRITGHGWRHLQPIADAPSDPGSGSPPPPTGWLSHGPHPRRYYEAVKWVERYSAYLTNLRECFLYSLNWRKRFKRLLLHVFGELPAEELIRLLEIQYDMLAKWDSEERRADTSTTEDRNHQDNIVDLPAGPGRKSDPTSQLAIRLIKEGVDEKKAIAEALRRDQRKESQKTSLSKRRSKIKEAIRYDKSKKHPENPKS